MTALPLLRIEQRPYDRRWVVSICVDPYPAEGILLKGAFKTLDAAETYALSVRSSVMRDPTTLDVFKADPLARSTR